MPRKAIVAGTQRQTACPPHSVGCPHDLQTRSTDPECHSPGCPHDPLSDDPARHARAWADLAPPGDDLAARQGELADLCVALFREGRSADDVYRLWMIVREYVDNDKETPPGTTPGNRRLAADARKAVPHAKRLLRELIRIHKEAADRNPFCLPDAKRCDGPSWSDCAQQYENALKTIDVDPAFAYLRTIDSRAGRGGNPNQRRNGQLADELRAVGLSETETTANARVTTILRALRFLA